MPQLATEWDRTKNVRLTPADVLPGSNEKVWWRCSACGHEWATAQRFSTTDNAQRCSPALGRRDAVSGG
jgi:hypothetical protein